MLAALRAKPVSLNEVLALSAPERRPFGEASQILAMLVGSGQAHPVLDRKLQGVSQAQALNRTVARRVLLGDEHAFLCAPTVGTAVPATFMDMCILLTLSGKSETKKQEDVIEDVWKILGYYGRCLIKNGVKLENKQESTLEIGTNVKEFFNFKYFYWRSIGIL